MDTKRFAAEAGISEQEAERVLEDALAEKKRIDEINEQVTAMNERTKVMIFRAKCGTAERELAFPVPASMVAWMDLIQLPENPTEDGDPMQYTVEGSKKIQLSISLLDLRRKF